MKRERFSAAGTAFIGEALNRLDGALNRIVFKPGILPNMPPGHAVPATFEDMR